MHRKFSSFFLVVECQYASSPLTHNCLQALETLPSFNVSLRSQYTSWGYKILNLRCVATPYILPHKLSKFARDIHLLRFSRGKRLIINHLSFESPNCFILWKYKIEVQRKKNIHQFIMQFPPEIEVGFMNFLLHLCLLGSHHRFFFFWRLQRYRSFTDLNASQMSSEIFNCSDYFYKLKMWITISTFCTPFLDRNRLLHTGTGNTLLAFQIMHFSFLFCWVQGEK